ncbi:hypothetical protein L1987_60175 [Smallanthus sonchifolius]|uniref:Uncharacterized protein n=1 Tax=Smallanthus sonchifolius TaxID=185202 RepID=A0ACB9D7P2_9ASTR|nr:hypothetical protein L1987_60175 [Smallanthus sonchifolius]
MHIRIGLISGAKPDAEVLNDNSFDSNPVEFWKLWVLFKGSIIMPMEKNDHAPGEAQPCLEFGKHDHAPGEAQPSLEFGKHGRACGEARPCLDV